MDFYYLHDWIKLQNYTIKNFLKNIVDEIVEDELPDLIKEYKKIGSQELRYALIKSLFESIQICEEKVKRAEKMKIAKDLVKGVIPINIILQTVGISLDEIQQV